MDVAAVLAITWGARQAFRIASRCHGAAHQGPVDPTSELFKRFLREARAAGQAHVFADWEHLNTQEKQVLLGDLQGIDFAEVNRIFKASQKLAGKQQEVVEPVTDVTAVEDVTEGSEVAWMQTGFRLVAEGQLAVLLLAGGQGTRLGSAAPKGCYDIGLPSHKSLFRLQAERLARLQQLAAEDAFGAGSPVRHPLRWYVMTSPATHDDTVAYFQHSNYFGLLPDQIFFFQQGQLPCLTERGKIILEAPYRLAKAPDGNGGVYAALVGCGALADMQRHGVKAVDCVSVDNALVRPGDPHFAGFCWERSAECGARVVAKAYPTERVGVFALRGGRTAVVEYSELDSAVAASRDPSSGALRYNWSNVCMHFFRVDWLARVAERLRADAAYHIARKSIPSKDGPVAGIKLELFIFDTFPLAERPALLEVRRDEEFAPVKNAAGTPSDSPDTARAAILALHRRWVEGAGGRVTAPEGVEVSPTVSYSGESLEPLCAGRVIALPFDSILQGIPNSSEDKRVDAMLNGSS